MSAVATGWTPFPAVPAEPEPRWTPFVALADGWVHPDALDALAEDEHAAVTAAHEAREAADRAAWSAPLTAGPWSLLDSAATVDATLTGATAVACHPHGFHTVSPVDDARLDDFTPPRTVPPMRVAAQRVIDAEKLRASTLSADTLAWGVLDAATVDAIVGSIE